MLRGRSKPWAWQRVWKKPGLLIVLIAVTVQSPAVRSALSEVFGRSKYFLLYSTDDNNAEFIINHYASELGGAGIQTARLLIGRNIDVLITGNIGLNPLRVFNSSGVDVYQCISGTAEQALLLLLTNKLNKYDSYDKSYRSGKNRNRGRRFCQNILPNNKNNEQENL
jgi:predicted Fe-Mo cluster-binding NifX family protein